MAIFNFDYPNISSKKSNEENIQATRAYLNGMADQLNYAVGMLEGRIAQLESEVESLKGEK